MSNNYFMLTFATTTDVMAAEALLTGYGGTVMPLPEEISADCGFAIKLSEREPGLSVIQGRVAYTGLYSVSGRGRGRVVRPVVDGKI